MATSSARFVWCICLLHIQLIIRASKGQRTVCHCAMLCSLSWVQAAYRKVLVSPLVCSSSRHLKLKHHRLVQQRPRWTPSIVLRRFDPVQHKQRRRTWDRASALQPSRTTKTLSVRKTESYLITSRSVQESKLIFSMWWGTSRGFFQFPADIWPGCELRIDLGTILWVIWRKQSCIWLLYTSHQSAPQIWHEIRYDASRLWFERCYGYARGSNGVCPFSFPSCQIIFDPGIYRLFTIVAHIPWLITYLRFIPGAAKVRTRVFAISEEYVNPQGELGSNIKT